ncbi:MAG TPA: PGPGW domain-containing protein [Gammaproteobacteria bacterium]
MDNLITILAPYAELLVGISLLSFIGSLLLVPILIIRIPADYFSHNRRPPLESSHPIIRIGLRILKNMFGLFLVLSGLIMLITPGQGLLTLLAGMVIMNYPGKFRLERWLVTRFRLLPAMNWIRKRYNLPPLVI